MSTIAYVQTDNSLQVTTQRSYEFDEPYSLVTMPLSGTTSDSSLSVESVRLLLIGDDGQLASGWQALEEVRFQTAWRDLFESTDGEASAIADVELEALSRSSLDGGADSFFTLPEGNAFAFDSRYSRIYVFLSSAASDAVGDTVIEFNYVIDQACSVYEDVAELYWDYVSPWLDAGTGEVRAQIQLPVPDGADIVPNETVRAWGHGPAGDLDIGPDATVDYQLQDVKEGAYAQAHVIFPASWLSNIPASQKLKKSGLRADEAIAGEASWTDSYTAGLVNSYLLDAVQLVLCILLLAGAVAVYALRGVERVPGKGGAVGTDAVGGAVGAASAVEDADAVEGAGAPERCAPSAVGREGADEDAADAVESAAGVAAKTLASVDSVVVSRLLRGNHWSGMDFCAELDSLERRGVIAIECMGDNARFRVTPDAKSQELSALDRKAMELVFDVVGDGYQSVSTAEVAASCKRDASSIATTMEAWHRLLDSEVAAASVFDARSKRASIRMALLACAVSVVGVVKLVSSGNLVAWAFLLTGIAMLLIASYLPRRTSLGCEVASQVPVDRSCAEWQEPLARSLETAMIDSSEEFD